MKNDHILVKKNLKLEHVKSGPSADFFLSLILWKPQHLIFIFCWNFHCQLKSNLRPLLERCAQQTCIRCQRRYTKVAKLKKSRQSHGDRRGTRALSSSLVKPIRRRHNAHQQSLSTLYRRANQLSCHGAAYVPKY